jgi:organic radical activating enzyme
LWSACNRACAGCCNNDWDLDALPVCESYRGFDEIILTGGEPMLNPLRVKSVVAEIRRQTDAPVYLYTAKVDRWMAASQVLAVLDGMTVTLHEPRDVAAWVRFSTMLLPRWRITKSLYLNVFRDVVVDDVADELLEGWVVKDNIEWIENCPLPRDEAFMRLDRSQA